MTFSGNDPKKDVVDQYRTSANLNARIRLHQRFSINPYGWFRWVFDQFHFPDECRILEFGCGMGDLWVENRERIPPGWQILLTDASEGMVRQAEQRLQSIHPFGFKRLDAQSIPYLFEEQSFDAVIANHMLYHLPDRKPALKEIQRILKTGGILYTTTVGVNHLVEIRDLLVQFQPDLQDWGSVANPFTLENGEQQLQEYFPEVKQFRYEDSLRVIEAEPLVKYILSGWARIPKEKEKVFAFYIENELKANGGEIRITKDSGMFVSKRS